MDIAEESVLIKVIEYDRAKEIKKFDETKAGVKGLVDLGIVKIPKLFVHSLGNLPKESDKGDVNSVQIPVIDLEGVIGERRHVIVEEIQKASKTWGFFQMVNHGIPNNILDCMIEGVKRFHEQPTEEKQKIYSRDSSKKVRFYSNGELYESQAAHWSDTLFCRFGEDHLQPQHLPFREIMLEYVSCIIKLRDILSELFSEALGLSPDYLSRIGCMKCKTLLGHYYPACPEPDITLGVPKHSDAGFLTIVLQDQIGGLQVCHQNKWVNVPPVKGALVANIGDLLQLITNDKFKSVEHRVLAKRTGPRISIATFFYPKANESKRYGPIEELLSEDNPRVYRETLANEYISFYRSKGIGGGSSLTHFKL